MNTVSTLARPRGPRPSQQRRAFTLIELVVVVIILGIIAAIAMVAFNRHVAKAKDTAAQADVLQFAKYLAAQGLRSDSPLTSGDVDAALDPSKATVADGPSVFTRLEGDVASEKFGDVSVALATDSADAGIAMKSQSHKCAVATVTDGAVSSGLWDSSKECKGSVVLATGVGSPADGGSGDAGGSGSPKGPAAPQYVTAQPGLRCTPTRSSTLLVSWTQSEGATKYTISIDGTQVATETGQSHLLTGADVPSSGTHQVTVTAQDGDGLEGAASTPVTFTGSQGNDVFDAADTLAPSPLPLTSVTTGDYDNTCASTEADGRPLSLWWTFKPSTTGTYSIEKIQAAAAGATQMEPTGMVGIGVFTGTSVDDLTTVATSSSTVNGVGGPRALLTAGTTYYIGVWNAAGKYNAQGKGQFALRVSQGPGNDEFIHAAPVGNLGDAGEWISNDVDNTTAMLTAEPGEPACVSERGCRSLWWTFTPDQTGSYWVEKIQPTADAANPMNSAGVVYVGVFTGSSVDALTTVAETSGGFSAGVVGPQVILHAGTKYYIRVFDGAGKYNTAGVGSYRMRVQAAPTNDLFERGTTVPASMAVGDVWRSPDVDNTRAAAVAEDGEPDCGTYCKSLWWTFTPEVSGQYTLAKVQPSAAATNPVATDGTTGLNVYTGALGGLTAVTGTAAGSTETGMSAGKSVSLTAGVTYHVRIYDSSGKYNTRLTGSLALYVKRTA